MAELLVIRHAQARRAGVVLRDLNWVPDRLVTGTLERQKDTLACMGFADATEEHAGFNEYDFHDLLHAKFDGAVPDLVMGDRKTHFRTLRETIFEWQAGGLPSRPSLERIPGDGLAFANDRSRVAW